MEFGAADGEQEWGERLARTPFAAALASGAPLIVARGDPARLAFATPAAVAAFGAADGGALGRLLFDGDGLSSRRLARLARDLPAGAPPRLEQLRYFVALKPVSVAWICTRLRRDGETFFVAAEPVAALEDIEPAAAAPPPPASPAPTRFIWRLDAASRFAAPDAVLVERIGAEAPRDGETLHAFVARVGLGPAWGEATAARRTFSRLKTIWPEPGGERGRVIWISGAPVFGAGGVYDGFHGFGIVGDERVALPPSARPARASPAVNPLAGDAAALLSLLQRQHGSPLLGAPGAPALAVISALAALLQPKAGGEAKAPAAPPPSGGAEIVRLRPHASVAAPDMAAARERRDEDDSVALTSQERDAFKEIARALGVNVRASRPLLADEKAEPAAEPAPAPARPADDDLAALLDILPVAVLVARDGEPLFANKTLLQLAGYADFADFRARDGAKAIFKGRAPAILAPGGAVAAIPLATTGDRVLTVDAHVQNTTWGGAPAELIAMRRSRDAEHQAELRAIERETAIHAARARDLSAALEAARDGMVRLDRSGRILGLNRGAEALLGYEQNEAAGDSFLSLLAPDSHRDAAATLERLARGEVGSIEALDATGRSGDGRVLPLRLHFGRLANAPEPDFFLLLTDRSKAEAASESAIAALRAAEQASAAKTDLLSRVSHEMRTPLNAIMGFAEVMQEERFGPIGNDRYRDYVRDILASGRHVLSLANDLLDLTKLELGKADLRFTPIDVNVIIRECILLMQPQAARERVIVRLSLYDRLPKVMADERSLRQILLNLMANAVKYNEPGGQVIVSTALDDGGHAVLRVRDTGVGMSDSELAIALEPFRRVPGVKDTEGAGLGLPIVKALVEANHADFTIKSRKDQGTLVEIAFPTPQAAQ